MVKLFPYWMRSFVPPVRDREGNLFYPYHADNSYPVLSKDIHDKHIQKMKFMYLIQEAHQVS